MPSQWGERRLAEANEIESAAASAVHLSRLRGRSHRMKCDASGGSLPTDGGTRGGTPTHSRCFASAFVKNGGPASERGGGPPLGQRNVRTHQEPCGFGFLECQIRLRCCHHG